MPKSNYLDSAILELLFNGTPIPNLADNAGTSPLLFLYQSLHTASPGAAGDQSSNEAAYPGYARVPWARSSGAWVPTAQQVNPNMVVSFPAASGATSEVETYWGIGTESTGSGRLLYFGTITPSIPMSNGVIPQLSPLSVVTES